MTLRLLKISIVAFVVLFAAPQFSFLSAAWAQSTALTDTAEETVVLGFERRALSLQNSFEAAGENDGKLASLRSDADELISEAREVLATVQARLDSSSAALAALGDVPAAGSEDATVSRQRDELQTQVQGLQARAVALNTAINSTSEIRVAINDLRRDAFTRQVLDRTELTGALLVEGFSEYRARVTEVRLLVRNWFVLNLRSQPAAFLGAFAFGLLVAFLVWVVLRRTISLGLSRARNQTEPKLFTKLNIAFWRAISKSLLVGVCLAAIYTMMQWGGLMGPKVSGLLRLAGICITGLAFIWYLS
ncbi:MAG: hypothetical protein AAF737_07755, partial [Pseudomonadota bacterium]